MACIFRADRQQVTNEAFWGVFERLKTAFMGLCSNTYGRVLTCKPDAFQNFASVLHRSASADSLLRV